jgi:hypothetical protein
MAPPKDAPRGRKSRLGGQYGKTGAPRVANSRPGVDRPVGLP